MRTTLGNRLLEVNDQHCLTSRNTANLTAIKGLIVRKFIFSTYWAMIIDGFEFKQKRVNYVTRGSSTIMISYSTRITTLFTLAIRET